MKVIRMKVITSNDEEYVYKLEFLYEWWDETQPWIDYTESYHNGNYTYDSD